MFRGHCSASFRKKFNVRWNCLSSRWPATASPPPQAPIRDLGLVRDQAALGVGAIPGPLLDIGPVGGRVRVDIHHFVADLADDAIPAGVEVLDAEFLTSVGGALTLVEVALAELG